MNVKLKMSVCFSTRSNHRPDYGDPRYRASMNIYEFCTEQP